MAKCKTCGGTGKIDCVDHDSYACLQCNATGYMECPSCNGIGNVEAAALSDGELREWLLGSVCNSHGVENSECEKYTCGNNCPYNILPKINNLIKTALATQKAEMLARIPERKNITATEAALKTLKMDRNINYALAYNTGYNEAIASVRKVFESEGKV
jgi:RecJ-like exonuclease